MKTSRFAAGAAAIAIAAAWPASSVSAQPTGADAPVVDRASAAKTTAADRRKARRERRRQRAAATAVPAAVQSPSLSAAAGDRAADQDAAAARDIVVTGTRIAGDYGRTGAPVQSVGRSELERRGLAHLEEALNAIPAVQPGLGNQTRNTNNNPTTFGRSPINLRNLGASRTLVLINGQRASNDTNNIPASMIERVEVLTGGASAIYGSDAVGGVVNYILKRNFTGLTIDGEGSVYQHRNDNREMRQLLAGNGIALPPRNFIGSPQGFINATGGVNFAQKRGNITAHIGYRATSSLSADKFDVTACALAAGASDDAPPGAYNDHAQRFCKDPETYNPYAEFGISSRDAADPNGATPGGTFSNAIDGSKYFRDATDTDKVRIRNRDYIYRADHRLDWGVNARFLIDESSQTEIVATYSRSRNASESRTIADEPISGFDLKINCDSPLLSNQQAALVCGPNAGNAQKTGSFDHIYYWPKDAHNTFAFVGTEARSTLQVKGKLTDDLRFDANIIHSVNRYRTDFNTYYSSRRLQDGIRVRSEGGKLACLPPLDPTSSEDEGERQRNVADDAACQPLDIFSTKPLDKAGYDYMTSNPGSYDNRVVETVANATLSGPLGAYGVRSPFAHDPAAFSLNVEGRRQQYGQVAMGSSYSKPLNYVFREVDLSGELAVPLLQDLPLIRSLQVSGAYRRMFFAHSTGNTWRVGLDYRVSTELALRSSYSASYRIDPYSTYYPRSIDPGDGEQRLLDLCSPPGGRKPTVVRLTADQCAALGVTAQQYAALSSRTDCAEDGRCPGNILTGGNPNLRPERSTSLTAGLTVTPKLVRNLSLGVDYYRINITEFISDVDAYISFIQCRAGTSFYCSRYHRDPTSGRLDVAGAYADGTPANFGRQTNVGIDFTADYRLITSDLIGHDLGDVALNFSGNLRLKNEQQKIPGSRVFDCTGYYGYGGKENCMSAPNPSWRHTVRAVWALPWSGLSLNALWRFTAPVRYAGLQSNPILSTPPTSTDGIISPRDAYLPASSFFDMGATIKVAKEASLRLTITNVFDKDPYLMVNNHGGWYNTQPLMYDVFGRRITLGFTARF